MHAVVDGVVLRTVETLATGGCGRSRDGPARRGRRYRRLAARRWRCTGPVAGWAPSTTASWWSSTRPANAVEP